MNAKGRKTYVYFNKNLIATADTATEAAKIANTSSTIVSECANGNRLNTFNGYWFSYHELTQEELNEAYRVKQKRPQRSNDDCFEQLSPTQRIQVNCDDRKVFYLERSRKARIAQLRQYIVTNLEFKWQTQDKKATALERRFLKEILESLE